MLKSGTDEPVNHASKHLREMKQRAGDRKTDLFGPAYGLMPGRVLIQTTSTQPLLSLGKW